MDTRPARLEWQEASARFGSVLRPPSTLHRPDSPAQPSAAWAGTASGHEARLDGAHPRNRGNRVLTRKQRSASPPFGLPSHFASNPECACGAHTILSRPSRLSRCSLGQPRCAPPPSKRWGDSRSAPWCARGRRDEERPERFAHASGAGRTRNDGEQPKGKHRCLPEHLPPLHYPKNQPPTAAQPQGFTPSPP
jgi:hypothetical protein